jgi:hypothetical protein
MESWGLEDALFFAFSQDLTGFSLTRIGSIDAGVVQGIQPWGALFYDASSNLIGSFGENGAPAGPSRGFSFTAPDGATIASMRLGYLPIGLGRAPAWDDFVLVQVPEPGAGLLLAFGMAGIAFLVRRGRPA